MTPDQQERLQKILDHGVLLPLERQEIENAIERQHITDTDYDRILANHPYAFHG